MSECDLYLCLFISVIIEYSVMPVLDNALYLIDYCFEWIKSYKMIVNLLLIKQKRRTAFCRFCVFDSSRQKRTKGLSRGAEGRNRLAFGLHLWIESTTRWQTLFTYNKIVVIFVHILWVILVPVDDHLLLITFFGGIRLASLRFK